MKTVFEGPNLHLKEDSLCLILDVKWGGRITRDQMALVKARGMEEAEDGTWYGDLKHRPEVEALVKAIDEPWVSREESRLRTQQIRGGR